MAKAWWTYEPEDEAREREADHFGEWRDEQENPPAPWQPQTSDQQGPVVGPAAAERFRQAVRPQPAWRAAFRSPRTAPETPTLEPAPPIPYGLSQPPEITTGQRSPTVPGPAVQDLPMPPPAEARQPSSRPEPSPMDLALAGAPVRVPQPEPWRRAFSAVPGPSPLQMGPPPIEEGLPFGITREGAPEPAISPTRMATPAATATAPPGYVVPAGRGLIPQTAGFELAGRLPAEDTVEGRVLRAGIGDFAETAVAALERLGVAPVSREAIADWAAEQRQRYNPAQKGIENVEDFLDPRFWQTTVLRSVPMSLSLLPLAILGGTGGTAVASLLGAGWIGTLVLQAVGGGIVSGVAESLLEGGDAYKTARDKGLPQEEADKAFDSVFWKNTALLTGANGIEFALAFGKLPKPLRDTAGKVLANGLGRVGVGIARAIGSAGMEALEEGAQDIFQRQAEGVPIRWDSRLKTAMAAGAGMGAGFGAIGAASRQIEEQGLPAPGLSVEDVSRQVPDQQEAAYRQGQTMAEEKFKEETRPEDRIVMGITNVLNAAGLDRDMGTVWNNWQEVRDRVKPDDPFSKIADLMEHHAGWRAKQSTQVEDVRNDIRRQDWQLNDAMDALNREPGVFEITAETNRRIKNARPDLRKGSKAYAEALPNYEAESKRVLLQEWQKKLEAAETGLRTWWEKFGDAGLREIQSKPGYLRVTAADVRAVRPDSPVPEQLEQIATAVEKPVDDFRQRVDGYLTRLRETREQVALPEVQERDPQAEMASLRYRARDLVPEGKDFYTRARINGAPAWGNGFLLEMGEIPPEMARQKWHASEKVIDATTMVPPVRSTTLARPAGLFTTTGGHPMVLLVAEDGQYQAIDANFFAYFAKRYPKAQWSINTKNSKGPARIDADGRLVGVVMPLYIQEGDPAVERAREIIRERSTVEPVEAPSPAAAPPAGEPPSTDAATQEQEAAQGRRYWVVQSVMPAWPWQVIDRVTGETVQENGRPVYAKTAEAAWKGAERLEKRAARVAQSSEGAVAEPVPTAATESVTSPPEASDTAVRPAGERPAVPATQAEAGVSPPTIPSPPAAPAVSPPTAARPAPATEGAPVSAPPAEQADVRRELADGLRDLADRLAGEPATARTTPEAAVVEEGPTEALVEPAAEKAEPTERAIEPNQEERFTQIERAVREKPNISLSALLEARQSIADIQAMIKAGRLIEHPGPDSPTYSLPELPLTIEDLDAEAAPRIPSAAPATPVPGTPAPPPNHVPTLPPVTPTAPTPPPKPAPPTPPPKPPAQPPLPVPPKPPAPQESDIPRLEDMQVTRDAPPPTPALAEQLGKLWESYVRTFHSQTSPLKHWQRDAERLTGKKLSSKHQPYLYRRAQPGASAGAEKHMRFKLGPILRMVPEAAWHWWDDFLIKYDQVDKAAAVGRAVEKKIMADPVAETHKQVKRDETAWKAAKREARKADAQAKQTKDPADIASAQEKMANALALKQIYDQHKALGDAVDAAQAALVAAQGAARAARTAAASARLAVYRARNDPARLAQAQADYQQAMGLSQTAKAERTQKEQEKEQAGRAMAKAVADVVLASRKWAWGTRPERLTASMDDLRRQIGDELFAQIEKASQQLWRYGHELLAMKRDAGLISTETYDDWTQNFPHYMPIQIVAYLEQMDAGERPGVRSISTSDNDIHSLTEWGSEETIRSPLKAYEDLTYRTYGLVYKNRASQAMALVAEEPGAESIIREAKEWTDERGRHHVEKSKHGEQLLSAFLDGQQHRYLIPQEYHDAIRMHNAELTKLGLVILRTLLRTPLQYTATIVNIAFLPINVMGDAHSFFVREGRMQDMVRHPLETTKEYAQNLAGVFFDDAVMRELYEYGGGSSGAFFEGEPHGRQSLRDIARAHWYEVKDMRDVARLGKGLITLQPIRYLGSRAEMLPKRKAYRQRLAQGYSIEEAIVMAREANMDFAEGGSFTMFWNNFIPFFNVAWKAPYQLVTTFKNDPKGAIARLMVAVILPTVLAEIWNRADPDREKDYEDVWDYVKHSAIAVMAPWTGSFKDRLGKRIPEVFFVPTREFTPFVIATRQALKVFRGQYPDRWDKLVKGVMQSWSPVQTSGAAEMASTFMPPLLSSMVEIGTNRDFYRDRPLVPEELRYLPAGQQVQPWTTETAKLFSRTIGVPPAYVDHFVRANFAGVGQQALGATDLAIRGVREVTGQTVQKAAPAMEPGEEVWGWWVPKEGDARAVPGTDLPPLLAEAEGGKGALYVVYARSEADVKSRVYDQKYVGLVGTSAPFTRRREGAGFGEEVARATIGSLAGRFVRSGGGQRAEREREAADQVLGPGTAAQTRKAWSLIRPELDQIAKEQRGWDDRLATRQIPGNEWRRETQRLGERRRGELKGISAALPAAALTGTKAEMYRHARATLGGLLPDDRERAEYLSEVYLSMEPKPAPDGLPDMDEFFERRKAYMDALPQEEQQAVQAYLSRNASPIQKQYQRAQEVMAEYMAMPRWMGVTKERSDEMHQAEQQLRAARGKLPPAMENKTERALSLLALKDPQMAILAREAHQRPRNQQRSLFRFRNADLLDRFYSDELRAEQAPEEAEPVGTTR